MNPFNRLFHTYGTRDVFDVITQSNLNEPGESAEGDEEDRRELAEADAQLREFYRKWGWEAESSLKRRE